MVGLKSATLVSMTRVLPIQSVIVAGCRVLRYRDAAAMRAQADRPFVGYREPWMFAGGRGNSEFDVRAFEPGVETLGLARVQFSRIGRIGPEQKLAPVGQKRVLAVSVSVPPAMRQGTDFYGTGEVAGSLNRNGTVKTLYNNDCFDYTDESPSLYQSHPYVLAVLPDGRAIGVIVETTARLTIDLRDRGTVVAWRAETPTPDGRAEQPPAVTVIEGPDPLTVTRALQELTGYIPMPPKWALGYHQCRWSYEPEAKFRELAVEFRRHRVPCDVLWFDIDYMDGFRCFTTDTAKFPDMAVLTKDLRAEGFRSIAMIDPGLKADSAYGPYAQGIAAGHFVTRANGEVFHGDVWPGSCAFPNFLDAGVRAWWAGLYADFMKLGWDGIWNDMNEPAVFGGVQKTMPADNVHKADAELSPHGVLSHEHAHNIYGLQMVRASREGIAAANPGKRPFVLTRANFLGGQRYAATWTGDNRSDWNHLAWSVTMALNLSLSAQPFCGPDIGGFAGNADAALFARWMGIGAMLPFCRGHSVKESVPHEPYAFGDACTATCRRALERRMRLLPTIYTLFWRAATSGETVVRPLFTADPSDVRLRAAQDSFLLGANILVRCDVTPDRSGCKSPFPHGESAWARLHLHKNDTDNLDPDLPELYLRRGSAVALDDILQHTGEELPQRTITVVAAKRADGLTRPITVDLYEDEGDGFGVSCVTTFEVIGGVMGQSSVGGFVPPERNVVLVEI